MSSMFITIFISNFIVQITPIDIQQFKIPGIKNASAPDHRGDVIGNSSGSQFP